MTDMEALRARVYGLPTIGRAAPPDGVKGKWPPRKVASVPLTAEERAEIKERHVREAREQAAWEREEARATKKSNIHKGAIAPRDTL